MSWPSDGTLAAYLDEALPVDQMAAIETALRDDAALRERLTQVIGRADAGLHSIGEIWRRHRLSCPTRDELAQFLLGILPAEQAAAIEFHLQSVGCRYCAANRDDLQAAAALTETIDQHSASRRQRFFQTSAGHLRQPPDPPTTR